MFIAFEGPDNTGKSTSAENLAWDGVALYNATKPMHTIHQECLNPEKDLVVTYDRIDWFSHMVYRLALPDHEWNDERPRTVFAMPDTHLVIKIHHPQYVELIQDELYESGKVALVNPMYYYFWDFFKALNERQEFALFKTVSIIEVISNPTTGEFQQSLKGFSSPVTDVDTALDFGVDSDEKLLELLRYDEQHRF